MFGENILEVSKNQRDLVIHVISQRIRNDILIGDRKVIESLENVNLLTKMAEDLLGELNRLENQKQI
jgi:hypothetical protein